MTAKKVKFMGDKSDQLGKEKPIKKVSDKMLPKDSRDLIKSKLEKLGINTSELSDKDLIEKLSFQAGNLFDQKVKREVKGDSLQVSLKAYAHNTNLNNIEFISKLYHLTVPHIYLPLFRDHDKHLSPAKIWKRIRNSNIKPRIKITEIFYDHASRPDKKEERVYFTEF